MDESLFIAQRLFSRTTHGIKLGLERMQNATGRFGNPQDSYPSIHVAGTNGKGSTCAYIEAVLRSQGHKTGLFTSPHIVSFEERFVINGRPVASGQWVDVFRDLEPTIEELGCTFFEAATLIAFELFKREHVGFAVFEAGMGGRLDSTNVISPRVCAITRIAMDHMHFLGSDILSIAREKLGIVKKGVPCIMADPESRDVRDCAQAIAREKQAHLEFANAARETRDIKTGRRGGSFVFDGRRFTLPLSGAYQVQNALVAIKTLAAAGITDMQKTAAAMEKAFLPGRFQAESVGTKKIIFDVGHNPDAAEAFTTALSKRFEDHSTCLVIGIMKDKDMAGMFAQYCKKADRIILARPKGDRSADTAVLKSCLPEWFHGTVQEISSVSDAVRAALSSSEKVICVAGSFLTVGEAMVGLGFSPYP
jgi:dihydrofolate synthase / folylpolyglutamate synthase